MRISPTTASLASLVVVLTACPRAEAAVSRATVEETQVVNPQGATRVVLKAETEGMSAREAGEELAARPFVDIYVGPAEGRAIIMALKDMKSPRPMTHDLFSSALEALEVKVVKVTVTKLEGGTFFAELVIERDGKEVALDARPSDCMALALRAGAPIYVSDQVLKGAGRPAEGEEAPPGPIKVPREFI